MFTPFLTQLTSQASGLCASDEHAVYIQQTLQVKVASGSTVESIGDRRVFYLKVFGVRQDIHV